MGSLEKLSESIAAVGKKKEAIDNVMKLMMREWDGIEENSRTIQDLSAQAIGQLESKHKQSEAVVASVKVSYEMLNSKKKWLEEGLKKLDENYRLVRGVSNEVEQGQLQFKVMRDSMDQQFKELALKEQQIQHLSESLEMTPRKDELELMEKGLNKRKDDMDLRQKQLEARELEACTEQKLLKKMQQQMEAEKKVLEGELESRKASLVERESSLALKERALVERESEFDRKQKIWESKLEASNASLAERESVIVSQKLDLELKEKLLEQREILMQSKTMRDPREKTIYQSDSYTKSKSAQGIRMGGNGRGFGGGVLVKDPLRRDSKRQRSGDGLEELTACLDPKSGSKDNLQLKISEEKVVVLDDSASDSEVKGTQKRELVRRFNVGETWACIDAGDRMPRTYGKIIGVTERGRSVRVEVEWMKPSPKLEGERKWVSAGLPVGCGTFEPSRRSFEYPRILVQPMFSAGNPSMIVPFIGETWAMYKDWDLKTWSSRPDIHKKCQYEIVEILPYPEGGSSSVAVKVAYLEKVRGSICSFQRRSKKAEECSLIKPDSLYRFSHKVPSSRSSSNDPAAVFELDQSALPPGL